MLKENIEKTGRSSGDTGSATVQITHLTERIEKLGGHFKEVKKDFSSKRGYLKLINKRKKLLKYLRNNNPDECAELIKRFNI